MHFGCPGHRGTWECEIRDFEPENQLKVVDIDNLASAKSRGFLLAKIQYRAEEKIRRESALAWMKHEDSSTSFFPYLHFTPNFLLMKAFMFSSSLNLQKFTVKVILHMASSILVYCRTPSSNFSLLHTSKILAKPPILFLFQWQNPKNNDAALW